MRGAGARGPDLEQESLEDAIAQVKGVFACQVVLDGDRHVQEVHAIGTAQRSAKQIVRDIETLLRVRFGLPIDYRKISLVQLDDLNTKRMLSRLQLGAVAVDPTPDGYTVTIAVQQDKTEFRGTLSGGHTLAERLQLAAQATLSAVGQIVRRDGLLALCDARLFTLAGQEVVAVAVMAWFPTGNEQLVGLSIVRDADDLVGELLAAAGRATLASLNRRLPLILSLLEGTA